jgi:hypothetical protein
MAGNVLGQITYVVCPEEGGAELKRGFYGDLDPTHDALGITPLTDGEHAVAETRFGQLQTMFGEADRTSAAMRLEQAASFAARTVLPQPTQPQPRMV